MRHMPRERASSGEWDSYYQRAEQIRAIAGDPFRKHLERVALRERAWLAGATLLLVTAVGAFLLLAVQQ